MVAFKGSYRVYSASRHHVATRNLMGHTSYDKTTEKYYVMGQSRLAGKALAKILDVMQR